MHTKNNQPEPSAIVDVIDAFESSFQFKLGQTLAYRQMVEGALAELQVNGGSAGRFYRDDEVKAPIPNALIVTSRWADECPGGVQFHYSGLLPGKDGQNIRHTFMEHELMDYAASITMLEEGVTSARAQAKERATAKKD